MNSYKTTGSRPWDGLWGWEVSGDTYKILVQCAVKVKGATLGLDNTPITHSNPPSYTPKRHLALLLLSGFVILLPLYFFNQATGHSLYHCKREVTSTIP